MVSPGITGLAQVSGLRGDFGDVEVEMKKSSCRRLLCKELEFCSGPGYYIKNHFAGYWRR